MQVSPLRRSPAHLAIRQPFETAQQQLEIMMTCLLAARRSDATIRRLRGMALRTKRLLMARLESPPPARTSESSYRYTAGTLGQAMLCAIFEGFAEHLGVGATWTHITSAMAVTLLAPLPYDANLEQQGVAVLENWRAPVGQSGQKQHRQVFLEGYRLGSEMLKRELRTLEQRRKAILASSWRIRKAG